MYLRLLIALFVLASCAGAFAATVTIEEDRMAAVDGKRVFVLGLYENPKDDAVLKDVADAGFNLVRASGDKAALDRLQAQGLGAWINTGMSIDLSQDTEARKGQLSKMAGDFAGHPALLVWEVPDEALWNCWYGAQTWRRSREPAQQREKIAALEDKELAAQLRKDQSEAGRLWNRGEFRAAEELADGIWRKLGQEPPNPNLNNSNAQERADTMCGGMIEGYKLLKGMDPAHPIWMNHAPRNQIAQLAAFNEGADAVGCDIYPAPAYKGGHSDLMDRSLSSVGAFTTRMQDAAPGKPVWMVLQGFGWADLADNPSEEDIKQEKRRPTYTESRFMAFDSIVRGARGILYWGTAYIEKDSELWQDLLRLVRELADLQPVLSAPDADLDIQVSLAPAWGSVDRNVLVLPKAVNGETWLLVVNEFTDPLVYTLSGLEGLDGTVYADPDDEREATVSGGKLTLPISGQRVQILRPGK